MSDFSQQPDSRERVTADDDVDLSSIPPGRWKSLVDDLASFVTHVRERGVDYAVQGRVGSLAVSDLGFSAMVRGRRDYRTEWHWDGDLWLPECTCKAGPYCKHAYALACCVLDRARRELGFFDRRLARLVPHGIPAPSAGITAIPAGNSTTHRPVAEPLEGERDRGRVRRGASERGGAMWRADASFRSSRPATLADLLKAVTSWDRALVLSRMLGARGDAMDFSAPPFDEILEEADAELMCWRLAQELPPVLAGPLPAALEPYRLRADLEERFAARELPAAEAALMRWAGERAASPPRSLRMVIGLDRGPRGEVTVTTELRLTSPRMHDAPRSLHQLAQLQSELRRKPGLLAADQALLLQAVLEAQERSARIDAHRISGLAHLLRRIGETPLVRWSDALPEDLARQAAVTPGAVVRISAQPVRLQPASTEERGEARIVLRFEWPDGSHRPLDEVLYFQSPGPYGESRPGLILCDGQFFELIEEPPADLVARFRRAGGVPVRRERRDTMLAELANAFPSVRQSLANHIRHHDVTPAVLLDLRDDDWLQMRVLAHTPAPGWRPGAAVAALFEYTPENRWAPATPARDARARGPAEAMESIAGAETAAPASESPEPAAPSPPPAASPDAIWFEAPAPERVAPVTEWLRGTGARPGEHRGGRAASPPDAHIGWWIKLNARNVALMADAWARRPAGVEWFGNQAVRRLLGRRIEMRPRLRIRSSGVDWFVMSAEWETEGESLTDEDLARLRGATTSWVKLSAGWTRRDAVDVQDQAAAVFADLGLEAGGGDQKVTLWQLAAARPESLAALERLGADPATTRAIGRMREQIAAFRGLPAVPVPDGFVGELRPYQQQGLDFLVWSTSLGLGVVLADDMGLGKTIQALAWIQHRRNLDPDGAPCLVVCPTSVIHNWEREAARFTPRLRVLVLASGQERHVLRQEVPGHDVIVTSYALLRRDLEAWQETPLGAVILDEAQNIKNPDTAIARAVLELHAPYRLALTGTPLENRALDLWSIMRFLDPGYLGDRAEFSSRYDRIDAPPHSRALLAARLRPVMLRRMKREVASDLPERIEERRDCELTPGQRQLYAAELLDARRTIAMMSADPEALRRNKLSILTALTRLRQICCHPALVGGAEAVGSGKFEALFELLEPLLAEGHKVLLFSQFVRCLDLLAAEMNRRGIRFHTLTGKTTRRDEVVRAFTDDPQAGVFLISLKAGGTGLNLTAASYVVLFDPWWNPAVEAQAIDRTHRIGQDRTVIAYRMLAQGTIEEKIWELQQKKAALIRDVLGEDGFARTLDREDLEFLLAEF
jgi:superfamily II DNA or RNA helicase